MKIITKDNFCLDLYTEKVVAFDVSDAYGKEMVELWNAKYTNEHSPSYLSLVDDDYVLYDGYSEMYGTSPYEAVRAVKVKQALEFLTDLIEGMEGTSWRVNAIVDYELVSEDDRKFAKVEGQKMLEEQEDHYIYQNQSGEDSYYGNILYPINSKKALLIDYACQ